MRRLVITENITLDGVIDAAGGWFNVTVDPDIDQSDMLSAQRERRNGADAVLMGRTTFEQMRGFTDATGVPPLRHVETQPFDSGIVLQRYQVMESAS